jgi:hypothetical protein
MLASQQLMVLKREIGSEKGEDCAGCGEEKSLQRKENSRLSRDGIKAGLSGELDPLVRCGQLSFELRDSARSKIEENRYREEVFQCPSGREETRQGGRIDLDTRRKM